MAKYKKILIVALTLMALPVIQLRAQESEVTATAENTEITESAKQAIQQIIAANLPENMGIGTLKARNIDISGDSIKVDLSENFGDVPFTTESIDKLKKDIKSTLGEGYDDHKVYLTIAGNPI
ncbi:MAG: GerMN domain-containing protein, partial [Muribaculaceae bacterium]|nr:GerMN domain-containing protein [Muribaculaceae bacterium]